jgi:hypothetical protein
VGTVEKIFVGFTAAAIVGTIFTSQYSAGIFGSAAGGIAKIYAAVKH